MFQERHLFKSQNQNFRSSGRTKVGTLLLFLLVSITFTVIGTVAYLFTKVDPVVNTFTPSHVSCEVTEKFENNIKSEVNVKNTGDTEVYIRVKLVTYRVNGNDNHRIGGTATVPNFDLGDYWVKYNGYYYYTLPVAPGKTPKSFLTADDSITLESYTDADGGRQVIEVIAEAIQSGPPEAVGESWNVTISQDQVSPYN